MERHENHENTTTTTTEASYKTEKAELYYECALCRVIFANLEEFQSHEIFCEVAGEEQIETTTTTTTAVTEIVEST